MRKFNMLLLLLLLISCSKDNKFIPDVQYTNRILPLAIGNYWVYTDSVFTIGQTATVDTTKFGITGYRHITYNNQRETVYYWNWYNMPEDIPQRRRNLVRNEEDGLMYYGQVIGSAVSTINRSLFIKYPVVVGNEWPFTGGYSIENISVSTLFETPVGVFDCYVYSVTPPYSNRGHEGSNIQSLVHETFERSEYANLPQELYYSPEVGYVGMIVRNEGTIVYKKTLIDYYVQQEDEGLMRFPDRLLTPH